MKNSKKVIDLDAWKEANSFYNGIEKILYPDRTLADVYKDHSAFLDQLRDEGGDHAVKYWRDEFWANQSEKHRSTKKKRVEGTSVSRNLKRSIQGLDSTKK